MYCTRCGSERGAEDRFCSNCGSTLPSDYKSPDSSKNKGSSTASSIREPRNNPHITQGQTENAQVQFQKGEIRPDNPHIVNPEEGPTHKGYSDTDGASSEPSKRRQETLGWLQDLFDEPWIYEEARYKKILTRKVILILDPVLLGLLVLLLASGTGSLLTIGGLSLLLIKLGMDWSNRPRGNE